MEKKGEESITVRLKIEKIETFKSCLSTMLSLLEVESQAHTILTNDDGFFGINM